MTAAATPRWRSREDRRRRGTTSAPASPAGRGEAGGSVPFGRAPAGAWPASASAARAAVIRDTSSSGIGPGSGSPARRARIPVGSCSTGRPSSCGWVTGSSGTGPRGIGSGGAAAGRRGPAVGRTSRRPRRFRRPGNGGVGSKAEDAGQRLTTAEAPRLHRPLGDVEHLGCLRHRQSRACRREPGRGVGPPAAARGRPGRRGASPPSRGGRAGRAGRARRGPRPVAARSVRDAAGRGRR